MKLTRFEITFPLVKGDGTPVPNATSLIDLRLRAAGLSAWLRFPGLADTQQGNIPVAVYWVQTTARASDKAAKDLRAIGAAWAADMTQGAVQKVQLVRTVISATIL